MLLVGPFGLILEGKQVILFSSDPVRERSGEIGGDVQKAPERRQVHRQRGKVLRSSGGHEGPYGRVRNHAIILEHSHRQDEDEGEGGVKIACSSGQEHGADEDVEYEIAPYRALYSTGVMGQEDKRQPVETNLDVDEPVEHRCIGLSSPPEASPIQMEDEVVQRHGQAGDVQRPSGKFEPQPHRAYGRPDQDRGGCQPPQFDEPAQALSEFLGKGKIRGIRSLLAIHVASHLRTTPLIVYDVLSQLRTYPKPYLFRSRSSR